VVRRGLGRVGFTPRRSERRAGRVEAAAARRLVDAGHALVLVVVGPVDPALLAALCAGPEDDRACMTYVPFERRYRGRPECLRDR
jgi:hypothetical protein